MAGLSDTNTKVARMQLEPLRQSSPAKWLQIMSSLSAMAVGFSRKCLQQKLGDAQAARIEWVQLHYGAALAEQLGKESPR